MVSKICLRGWGRVEGRQARASQTVGDDLRLGEEQMVPCVLQKRLCSRESKLWGTRAGTTQTAWVCGTGHLLKHQ